MLKIHWLILYSSGWRWCSQTVKGRHHFWFCLIWLQHRWILVANGKNLLSRLSRAKFPLFTLLLCFNGFMVIQMLIYELLVFRFRAEMCLYMQRQMANDIHIVSKCGVCEGKVYACNKGICVLTWNKLIIQTFMDQKGVTVCRTRNDVVKWRPSRHSF